MKVSGFSFIKNAIIYDYPVVEAIKSILPVCDEFVVAVGKSDDETLSLIENIDKSKIKIIETVWEETLRTGGRVLALETDKAFASVAADSDWAFYIQGDEVMHEKYSETVRKAMKTFKDDSSIDGLLFKYLHFYGSYDFVGTSSQWYNHEIRIIKNNKSIFSYRDAQGFRKNDNEKLRVKPIDACIYHYGWVKEPKAQQKKQENFHKLWHDEKWIQENIEKTEEFDYLKIVSELKHFEGEHPEVMKKRIAEKNWKFDYDISFNKKTIKEKTKQFLKNKLGIDFSYKNYIKI
jgi:hypothetical protein